MPLIRLPKVALTAAPDLSAFRAAAPQGAKQQFQFAAGDAATDLMLGETATEAAPGRVTRLVADFDAQPRGRAALSLSGANKGLTWMVDGCSAAEGEALFARMQQKESPLKVFVVTAGVEGFIDLPDAYTLSLPALGALSLAQTMPLFDMQVPPCLLVPLLTAALYMQRKAGAFAHTFVTICKKDVALDKTLDLIEHQGKWAGPKLDMTFKQLGDNYYVLPGTPIAMLAQRTSYKESKAKVAAVTTESGGAVEIRGDAFPVLHQTAAGYFGKTVIPLDSLKVPSCFAPFWLLPIFRVRAGVDSSRWQLSRLTPPFPGPCPRDPRRQGRPRQERDLEVDGHHSVWPAHARRLHLRGEGACRRFPDCVKTGSVLDTSMVRGTRSRGARGGPPGRAPCS